MTISYTQKLIAIILCIVLVFSAFYVTAYISDKDNGNAQFFAANFCLKSPYNTEDSLSDGKTRYVISWFRNSSWLPESPVFFSPVIAGFQFVLDKLCFDNTEYSKDFYTDFKKAMYFLRI